MADEGKISANFISLLDGVQQRKVSSIRPADNENRGKNLPNQSQRNPRGSRGSSKQGARGAFFNKMEIQNTSGKKDLAEVVSLDAFGCSQEDDSRGRQEARGRKYKNQRENATSLGEPGDFFFPLDTVDHSQREGKNKQEKIGRRCKSQSQKESRVKVKNLSADLEMVLSNFQSLNIEKEQSVFVKDDRSIKNERAQGKEGFHQIGRIVTKTGEYNDGGRISNSVSRTKHANNARHEYKTDDTKIKPTHNKHQQKLENKPVRMMSDKFLESLLAREDSFVVTTLANPKSGFQDLLCQHPISPDLLLLIISVLNKVDHSAIDHLKMEILSEAFKPEFFNEIKQFCAMSFVEENPQRLMFIEEFFENILSLFQSVIDMFPSMMNERLKSVLVALNLFMKHCSKAQNVNVGDKLFEQWNSVMSQITSYLEDKERITKEHKTVKYQFSKPPNNFRDLPLVPIKDDFLCNKAFLRHNVTKGSFQDVENYLDIHFRLLREDFIGPLRAGIFEYVDSVNSPHMKRKYTNVKIYKKVQFKSSLNIRDTFGFLVNFDCEKKIPLNINWEYNKRFMVGSLLLLTDDHFKTFYLATVGDRDLKNHLSKGLVFIAFIPGTEIPPSMFEVGKYFTMAESEVYYEAYRHVLAALRRLTEDNFPMKQYIINVDTNQQVPPQYLQINSEFNVLGYKCDLLNDLSWPTSQQLKLNSSQYQAFKSALTKDFAVIQGPPGTGKTFLALKIAEVLLKNRLSIDTPIIVICYTNHALDQFLTGILNITKNLIRIGSQSQNEVLEDYNYYNVKKCYIKQNKFRGSALSRSILSEKFDLQKTLQIVEKKINDLNSPIGILQLSELRSVTYPHHYNELDGYILSWLMCEDNPLLIMQEISPTVDLAAAEIQVVQPDIFQNVNEFQEEDFIDEDDDKNAHRLADMLDDDYYDAATSLEERVYKSQISYSYIINIAMAEIHDLYDKLSCTRNPYEAFAIQNTIETKQSQKDFIFIKLCQLKDFTVDPQKLHSLGKVESVWEMNYNDRWIYYMTLVNLYCNQLKQIMQHLTDRYQSVLLKLNEARQLEDIDILKDADIVGLTTSGAAKRRVMLENLGTKIVIVEEAAEVLEAHIVTSLTKSVEHVIFIGDHKQLKPNPAVYELAKKYNMDLSLFERMLSNGLGCNMLDVQHRMRPEISSLIKPIYPTLMDHPSMYERPKVTGIDKYVFFLAHNKPEDQVPDSSSRQNSYEGDFLIALCEHMMLQGYRPEDITILATYTGQVWYMRKEKRLRSHTNPDWKLVRITPVDNFQGEENRIILLSLVRSNKEARIGFLSTENRVCVALSRAKEGLYIIGNMDNLVASSTIWPKIKQQLEQLNAVGGQLTLRCARHPDQVTQVFEAAHFKPLSGGGCTQTCNYDLPCGHNCRRKCHIIDPYHTQHKCNEPCTRSPCNVEGHKCPLLCNETCKPCIIKVDHQLACGHTITLRCHVEPASVQCNATVPVTLPTCQHLVDKPCHADVDAFKCTKPCEVRLPCGHACIKNCHLEDDPDHLKVFCMKECTKTNKSCRSNHVCKKLCYETCGDCVMPVTQKLGCGHMAEMACSMNENTFKCKKPCTRKLFCGHKCPLECWLACEKAICQAKVDKKCVSGHTLKNVLCCEPIEKRKCSESCCRSLACGHPCSAKCYIDCLTLSCEVEVVSSVEPACGHPAPKIPCHMNTSDLHAGSDELVQLCKEPCSKPRRCAHPCTGTCGRCMQGRLHVPCKHQCGKPLICGHDCRALCEEMCPPCLEKACFNTCVHGGCNTGHPCYKPCEPCSKPCSWVCPHFSCTMRCGEVCNRFACDKLCPAKLACGHPCLGLCGEPHPKICRICNAEDPLITGNPDKTRFVLLENCNHIVVWNGSQEYNCGTLPRCPRVDCRVPITKTMPYRHIFIKYAEEMNVKLRFANRDIFLLTKVLSNNATFLNANNCSESMNQILVECGKPFDGKKMSKKERSRVILGCLLLPIAKQENVHYPRLKMRLEYLAISLRPRILRISYHDILQIELEVTRFLRAAEHVDDRNLLLYNIDEYSWVKDRIEIRKYQLKQIPRLSVILKTPDVNKRWFRCTFDHWYVKEEDEPCFKCEYNTTVLKAKGISMNTQQPTMSWLAYCHENSRRYRPHLKLTLRGLESVKVTDYRSNKRVVQDRRYGHGQGSLRKKKN